MEDDVIYDDVPCEPLDADGRDRPSPLPIPHKPISQLGKLRHNLKRMRRGDDPG